MTPAQTIEYYRDHPSARWSALALVAISSFLTPLSLSGTIVAIPAIAEGLNANAVYVSWLPAAFLIANLISLLPAGRLADLYGRKKLFLTGGVLFVITSMLAGLSQSIEQLLLLRVAQGIAAAMFFSTGMAIVTSVFRHGGRGTAMGLVVACVYLGLSFGPLLGGIITDLFGWRWVFFGMAPFMLVSIALTLLKLKGEWRNETPHPVDWLGAALFAAYILLLFYGLTHLPRPLGWLGMVTAAGVLMLFVNQTRRAKYPLVNIKLVLQNRLLSRSIMAAVFMYAGNFSLIFLLSLYLQISVGMTPSEAGQIMMTQAIFMAFMAPLAGKLSDHLPSRGIATLGCLVTATGGALLFTIQPDSPLWHFVVALAVSGIGFGLFSTPNNNSALGSVPEEKLGIVSGIVNVARLKGQMIGTSLLSLMLSLYFGSAQINRESAGDLNSVYHWVVGFAFVFGCIAAWFSWQRGHNQPLG